MGAAGGASLLTPPLTVDRHLREARRSGQCLKVTDYPDQAAIARILLDEWDPLGIADIDEQPEQEYLYEASRVLDLVRAGADRTALIDYLSATARELTAVADVQRDARCADALLAWSDASR